MRSKKYKKILKIAGIIFILLISAAYFVGLQTKNNSIKIEENSENPADKSLQNNLKNIQSETSEPNNQNQKNDNEQIKQDIEKLVSVSLKVQDKNYTTKIKEGSSAYDLMNQLKTQGFIFSATKYSDLGFFVTEINGVKEDRKNHTYWTLYVNGKEAMVGASQLILKEGDSIEWKYENRKNY
jgi:hypothetical protein